MARNTGRRILPFRIPFFRIFYSTTYTVLYILTLCILAITPTSIIWTAIQARAYQYIFMVGGIYVLVAVLTIFIYSSRLYTNRTVLAAVGKAYLPVEDGEVGKNVRKMIVKQLERSAIVAWEGRPRDVYGEIYDAERDGVLPAETADVGHNDYTVGRIIQIDPSKPPWGIVRHPGWSSPSHRDGNDYPDVLFASVVAELPNLIEARAVSLAPADPTMTPKGGQSIADPVIVEALKRPARMGMRDYVTQLSYLGLIDIAEVGSSFLRQYEHARFCGRPVTEHEFADLMAVFSELLAGMTGLSLAFVQEIRAQSDDAASIFRRSSPDTPEQYFQTPLVGRASSRSPQPAYSPASSILSPVTAREMTSSLYLQPNEQSSASLASVVHHATPYMEENCMASSSSLASSGQGDGASQSEAGSVIRHVPDG